MTLILLLGSNNKKKRSELAAILKGLDIELVTPAELGSFEEPEETGETFEDNAKIKAFYYSRLTGLATLADDSGLMVDALDGRPGVRSSRFAGVDATDHENCVKLLNDLKEVPAQERTARFACTVVVASGDEILGHSYGTCEGTILKEKKGTEGFGYDPLFYYPPEEKTFAELSASVKNQVSHRAKALDRIRPVLEKL